MTFGDGYNWMRERQKLLHLRDSLASSEPLSFSLPKDHNACKLSPAEALLAWERSYKTLEDHRARVVMRAGCYTLVNALQRPCFFHQLGNSPHLTPRYDGYAFLREPSDLAGRLGALRFTNTIEVAARTSALVLASAMLQRALGLNAPLHPFLQTIDTDGQDINWPKAMASAAALLESCWSTYMVMPNSLLTGLDFVQYTSDKSQFGLWTPKHNLDSYIGELEQCTTDRTYSLETRQLYQEKLLEVSGQRAMATIEFLKLFLSPQAMFALAYGGYYLASTGVDRVAGLSIKYAGAKEHVSSGTWEKLVNNLVAASERLDQETLHGTALAGSSVRLLSVSSCTDN